MPLNIKDILPVQETLYQEAYDRTLEYIDFQFKAYHNLADEAFIKGDLVAHAAYNGSANDLLKMIIAIKDVQDVINGKSIIISRREFSKYNKMNKE